MEQKAKLIVIDGADSVGKNTQAELLMRRLTEEGVAVAKLDFPQYTDNVYGALLRECLDGKHGDFMALDPKIAATLYAADRFETKETLSQLLEEGRVVILDRYVSANMLHQGAKIEDQAERQEFFEWVARVEFEVFGVPRPDVTIYLNVPPEKSKTLLDYMVKIGKKTADVAELNREHQEKVARTAAEVAQVVEGWVSVDCMAGDELRPREDIHEEVYQIIQNNL